MESSLIQTKKEILQNNFRLNNFDLIRLFAALQVAFHHSLWHLKIANSESLLLDITRLFPGVPIFYFISGFLISKSYENNSIANEYTLNRGLRLYPGLIVCFIISIIIVYMTGYFETADFSFSSFIAWSFAQISFFQFYNPDFMRGYGVGVMNGSLGTISIELQFYIVVPLVYKLIKTFRNKSKSKSNFFLILLVFLFILINRSYFFYLDQYGDYLFYKLLGVSFAPWLYMFLIGILFQWNFHFLHKKLSGKFLPLLFIYIPTTFLLSRYFNFSTANNMGPFIFILLILTIFSGAYSFTKMSSKLLRKNDVSYGIYIYHMPIVNLLVYYGFFGKIQNIALILVLTIIMAMLSWFVIEKPCLKLKRHPLKSLT